VAVHLASQSLRTGESDLAIVGGVNLLLTPMSLLLRDAPGMISPTGRCRAFDGAADGAAIGEGCGMVILRRLSDAHANGERIHALVRGSAVCQSGESNGMTTPHGPAQERVVRGALKAAGVAPREVGFVEAHGNGTQWGDPIELHALDAAYRSNRTHDLPLIVGSAKTNIGYLEIASGIAGLIKAVLAVQHGEIPRNLHFEQPNPAIAWDRAMVRIPNAQLTWPSEYERRLAGVHAYGISGTNAHVIIEQPPQESSDTVVDDETGSRNAARAYALPLSARGTAEGARARDTQ
jgi:acyl transferase domain-containing protein